MPVSAVLDTNALISGLLVAEGHAARLIDAWLDGRFSLVTSLYQVEEVLHVLSYPRIARRLTLTEDELTAFTNALLMRATVTSGEVHLPGLTRDPKDDAIVACAVEGRAQFIVSGDQDLLVMGKFGAIVVLSPREFSERLGEQRLNNE